MLMNDISVVSRRDMISEWKFDCSLHFDKETGHTSFDVANASLRRLALSFTNLISDPYVLSLREDRNKARIFQDILTWIVESVHTKLILCSL